MLGINLRPARLALLAWIAFLVGLVILADSGRAQRLFAMVQSVPGGDKTGHFILFGMLSFLVNLRFRAAELRLGRVRMFKGSAIVLSLVTLEECSQLFFRSRSFDLGDLMADAIGIWSFALVAARYLQWRRDRLQPAPVPQPVPQLKSL